MMSKRIDELTRKQLVADVDSWTKNKTRLVRSATYLGITEDYTCFFRVPSVTANPPTTYLVKIKLLDYPDLVNDEDFNTREKVRLAIAGDLKISCNCPAYLFWGYKYILTQLETNADDPENRFPRVKNPRLQGVMCKHCYRAINAFPMSWTRIASDIERERFLRM